MTQEIANEATNEEQNERVLKEFDVVLKRIVMCLLTEDCSEKFKNSVAKTTRHISLFIQRECGQFGMTSNIYEGLMSYSRTHRIKFLSLLAMGNLSFEGRSNYKARLLVVTVGNGSNIISSHIPQQWLTIIDEPGENINSALSKYSVQKKNIIVESTI
jgi:hypothetical protein